MAGRSTARFIAPEQQQAALPPASFLLHLKRMAATLFSIAGRLALPLVLAAGLAACQPDEQAPDYRPEEAGTVDHAMCLLGFTAVPLREVRTGHHLVEAQVNGRTGRFILDTGANASVVDREFAAELGLTGPSTGFGGAIGVGGGGQARQVGIGSMTIEGMPIRQSRLVVAELGQILDMLNRVAGVKVYGILGQDVLNEHRAIIDVARPMLYLMAEDRKPAPVPAERCGTAAPGG